LLSPLEGTIPTEMGNLSRLAYLDFALLSDLRGSIPSQFVNLSRLSLLSLSDCFSDDIDFSSILLSLPTSLEKLWITSGGFEGTIPNEIGNYQSLKSLTFSFLHLTGTLPTEIGLLTELQSIHMKYLLQLVGGIPSEVGKLTHLTLLDLPCTLDETPLPSEIAGLSALKVLRNCV
jgi:Leucine-rich repeat (LRR) protein